MNSVWMSLVHGLVEGRLGSVLAVRGTLSVCVLLGAGCVWLGGRGVVVLFRGRPCLRLCGRFNGCVLLGLGFEREREEGREGGKTHFRANSSLPYALSSSSLCLRAGEPDSM